MKVTINDFISDKDLLNKIIEASKVEIERTKELQFKLVETLLIYAPSFLKRFKEEGITNENAVEFYCSTIDRFRSVEKSFLMNSLSDAILFSEIIQSRYDLFNNEAREDLKTLISGIKYFYGKVTLKGPDLFVKFGNTSFKFTSNLNEMFNDFSLNKRFSIVKSEGREDLLMRI